jgi:hypothetical protein
VVGGWRRRRAAAAASASASASALDDDRRRSRPPTVASVSRARSTARDAAALGGDVNGAEMRDGARVVALRLTAGVLSTVVVRSVLAPFERMKLEYILNHSKLPLAKAVGAVFQAEGLKGFWRGNVINLMRVCPYKAINFAAFDAYRGVAVALSAGAAGAALSSKSTSKSSSPSSADAACAHSAGTHDVNKVYLAVAGAAAGITSLCTCYPMDVVRTRMLVAGGMVKYGSVGKCFASIMTKEGLSGFYRGFLPALFALTPNGAVYYTMYDHLKSNRLRTLEKEAAERAERAAAAAGKAGKRGNGAKGAVIEMEAPHAIRVEQGYMMLFGAVAGCAAEFSTYPFEVIRRRMQMQMGTSSVSSAVGMKALRRMTKTLRVILNSRGIPGLYAGCVPGIAQVLPSAALGYYSYEMFKIVLDVD